MSRNSKRNRKTPFKNLHRTLHLEALEDRTLMTCNVISGFVYYDVNNNGLYEQNLGETPIANSSIELRNASNVVVGTTTTDAAGHYEFETDITQPGTDATLTKVVTFNPTRTNFNLQGVLDQFDPSLGDLQSIEIQHSGSITSEIMVENFSDESASDITGTVAGTLTLAGPNLNDALSISDNAGSFHAAIYDGNTDFGGTSGKSFGQQTANGSHTITLSGPQIAAYIGTGTVTLTEGGVATSNANGGGNLDVRIRSTGQSTVTVIYHYTEHPCLAPGDYTITQTVQPPGYYDGKEAKDGAVIPNSIGTDVIHVTLAGLDLPNNNFGELKNTQLSGHVWYDIDNDGVREANEAAIAGTSITLEGPGGPRITTTDINGYYEFLDLDPGTYTVRETQPDPYLDGKDNFGTLGGTVINQGDVIAQGPGGATVLSPDDRIQSITLAAGDNSENNDFGEIKPSSIAGHVWWDKNNDGVRDANEPAIRGATVTLTGFDDRGPVMKSMQTNAQGEYEFVDLRTGTYSLHESQPAGYRDGKDAIGTPGGDQSNDAFDNINLPVDFHGVDNDFGEIKVTTPDTPLPKAQNLVGYIPIISKTQLTNNPTLSNIPPALRAQMQFIVAANVTTTGRNPNLVQTVNGARAINRNSPSQVRNYIRQLWVSTSHRAMQVNAVYQDILHRAPTAQEKTQGVAQLNAGSQLDLLESLLISSEYQTLHGTQATLAQALYRDILNIVAGSTSTDALVLTLDTQPLNVVVHDLLMSDASIANLIDDTYRETVRRAATTTEIQRYTPQIQAGTLTLDELAQQLLASQEFLTLATNTIRVR